MGKRENQVKKCYILQPIFPDLPDSQTQFSCAWTKCSAHGCLWDVNLEDFMLVTLRMDCNV